MFSNGLKLVLIMCCILLLSLNSFAKEESVADAVVSKIAVNKDIDSLKEDNERLKYFFEKQSDFISLGFVVVTLLVGLVGVLFPVVVYLTTIRPSNIARDEALKAVRELDDRFKELLMNYKNKQLEDVVCLMETGDSVQKQFASAQLVSLSDVVLSESQIRRIVAVLKGEEDDNVRSYVHLRMIGCQSDYLDKYYFDLVSDGGISDLYQVTRYSVLKGKDRIFEALVTKSIADRNLLSVFVSTLWSISFEKCLALLNDRGFVDRLSDENITMLRHSLLALKQHKRPDIDVEDTYLYLKTKG